MSRPPQSKRMRISLQGYRGDIVQLCNERSFWVHRVHFALQIDLRISLMLELLITLFSVSIFVAHAVEAYKAQ